MWVIFVLTQKNAFSQRFYSEANRKILGIFKKVFHLRDKHGFMWQPQGIFERFQNVNFEKRFLKN